MALFSDYNPKTLEDTLGKQAQTQAAGVNDQYAQARKRLVSQQAHSGRLMSGVADYPLTDLDTEQAGQLSGIQDNLANAIGEISSEDYLNQRDYKRNFDLANLISSRMKPSTLEEVLSGIGMAGQVAGTIAAFG